MSAHPVNSPIQRLDFDVLSCIFKINGDMFDDHRALETTLATSRVCRDWRNIMLSTSSIWAHLIDFGDPNWCSAKGIHELARRSGISMPWIKVPDLYKFNAEWAKSILEVVGECLEQTQKLEVTIGWEHVDLWPQLYFPAPHLELFNVTFQQEWTPFDGIFSSLFGGTAPKLHELCFRGHMSNFTPQPSWLHQLRSLDLSAELTVSEMLEVLMSTKHLVTLRFDHLLADRTTSMLPLVSLPRLTHLDLKLHGKLGPGAVFLDHMCIPPACSVTISASWITFREIDNKTIFAPIIRAISSCARPHFIHHPPQQLWLTIKPGYFILQTATHSNGRGFKFSALVNNMLMQEFRTHTLTMLLSEFALPGLSNVTWFCVKITGVNRPVPGFTAFMASLPSVNAITTDKYSLRHLRAWSPRKGADTVPRIGFPALKILKLVSADPPYWHHSNMKSAPDPVSAYVKARSARGHAISVVDFTEKALDVLPDMPFLSKAVGLKVRWRQRGVAEIRDYICGTGPPQKVEYV